MTIGPRIGKKLLTNKSRQVHVRLVKLRKVRSG